MSSPDFRSITWAHAGVYLPKAPFFLTMLNAQIILGSLWRLETDFGPGEKA